MHRIADPHLAEVSVFDGSRPASDRKRPEALKHVRFTYPVFHIYFDAFGAVLVPLLMRCTLRGQAPRWPALFSRDPSVTIRRNNRKGGGAT